MARGTMHSPKPDDQRRRRNKPAHDGVELQHDGEVRGPELEDITGRDEWSDYVRQWYHTWRTAPQAQAFLDTDWQRLGMLAFGVAQLEKRFSAATMSEIRMNEERLGATVTDRMRARMNVEKDEDKEDAPVVELKSVKNSIKDQFK